MPVSASDYTTYLKYQSAMQSVKNGMPPRPIQTVSTVAPSVSIMNAYVKASEASYRTNASGSTLNGLARVAPMTPMRVNTAGTTQLHVAPSTARYPTSPSVPQTGVCISGHIAQR